MKTQILRLEPDDDIISASDKLGWGQTGRILLIWPPERRILTDRLDMVLLKRKGNRIGAQIALITEDPVVQANASSVDIPVFTTIEEAQSSPWRRKRRRKPAQKDEGERPDLVALRPHKTPSPAWLQNAYVRLAIFTIGVIGVLGIASLLIPSAQIEIKPESISQTIELPVRADPEVSSYQLTGVLPIQNMTITVEGRDSLPVSGELRVPFQPASGAVTFTNLTDAEVIIPADSTVRTGGESPVRFNTLDEVVIPAGPGEQVSVDIQALAPGSAGNLPPGSLELLDGPLGLSATVSNAERTSGGTDRTSPAPSEADYQAIFDQLFASLLTTATNELDLALDPSDYILSDEPRLESVLQEDYQPAEVQAADEIYLTLRLEFVFEFVSAEDILALVTAAMDANIPQGYTPLVDSISISHLEAEVSEADERSEWVIFASRRIGAQLSEAEIINLALGRSVDAAVEEIMDNLPVDGSPVINMSPGFWSRLPFLPFRIQVVTQ